MVSPSNDPLRGLLLRSRGLFAVLMLAGVPMHPGVGEGSESRQVNRLATESSPYLQLHAHNPVNWYPWGEEAFAKARRENKPIFLSVGYSTCYWCHVMEREVFSDPTIAQQMNEWFVSIKVDKDERTPRHRRDLHGCDAAADGPRGLAQLGLSDARSEAVLCWHLNANPTSFGFLKPTQVEGAVRAVSYPAGRMLDLSFAESPVSVYSGTLTLEGEIADGETAVLVTYQACDDRRCLPAITRQVAVSAPGALK